MIVAVDVAERMRAVQLGAMTEGELGLAIAVETAAERYSESLPEQIAIRFLAAYYHGSEQTA